MMSVPGDAIVSVMLHNITFWGRGFLGGEMADGQKGSCKIGGFAVPGGGMASLQYTVVLIQIQPLQLRGTQI